MRRLLWTGPLSDERGAAAVEFAMVLPVICLMLFTVIQFGETLNNYIELAHGVSAGAHEASVLRGTTTPYGSTVSAIDNAAQNLPTSKMTITISINNGTKTQTCTTDTGAQCQGIYPSTVGGGYATVNVTYPCNLSFMKISIPGCLLSSSATEIVQ